LRKKELIKSCIKKDKKAQKLLYETYKESLYMLSLKYCRNTTEAEDNLHDAFITIFDKIHSYKEKGSFEGWMKRITIYKAIDKYKKNLINSNDERHSFIDEDSTEDVNVSKISLDTILEAIQQLPDQYRLAFNLYELDNYSHKEIAEILSISEGTSKSNLHRAKSLLREKLTPSKKTKKQ
jgi:RNA polymerase sigma factor (sigma-70 family)